MPMSSRSPAIWVETGKSMGNWGKLMSYEREPVMALAWKIMSYEVMVLFRKTKACWGVMCVMYIHQETQMGS